MFQYLAYANSRVQIHFKAFLWGKCKRDKLCCPRVTKKEKHSPSVWSVLFIYIYFCCMVQHCHVVSPPITLPLHLFKHKAGVAALYKHLYVHSVWHAATHTCEAFTIIVKPHGSEDFFGPAGGPVNTLPKLHCVFLPACVLPSRCELGLINSGADLPPGPDPHSAPQRSRGPHQELQVLGWAADTGTLCTKCAARSAGDKTRWQKSFFVFWALDTHICRSGSFLDACPCSSLYSSVFGGGISDNVPLDCSHGSKPSRRL